MRSGVLVALATLTALSCAEAAPAAGKAASKPKYYVPREVEQEAPVQRRANVPVYQPKKRQGSGPLGGLLDQFLGNGRQGTGTRPAFPVPTNDDDDDDDDSSDSEDVSVVVTVGSDGQTLGRPVTVTRPDSDDEPTRGPLLSLGLGGILPTGIGRPPPRTTEPSESSSSTNRPLIPLPITSLLNPPPPVPTTTDDATTSDPLIDLPITSILLPPPTETVSDPTETSSTNEPLIPLPITSILDPLPSTPPEPSPTSDTSVIIPLPDPSTILPPPPSVTSSATSDTTSGTTSEPTISSYVPSSTFSTTEPMPTDSTALPPTVDTNTTSSTTIPSITAYPTTDVTSEPTTSATPPPPVTTSSAPQSLEPTGSDSATTQSVESSITIAPVPSDLTTASTRTIATAIPTDIPRRIQPNTGVVRAPRNSSMIQLAFNASLPYDFVLTEDISQSQIFYYVHKGLKYALDSRDANIAVAGIVPFTATLGQEYIRTVVQSYIHDSDVSTLKMMIHNANSAFYQQEDPSAGALFAMVDSAFPIDGKSSDQGTNPATQAVGADPASSSDSKGDDDAVGGDSGNSSSVRGISVGIATGVVAGAALYGGAMFFVAKRYRKRRAAHQRASSVVSGSRMVQYTDGPSPVTALMSGSRNGYRSTTPGGRDSRNSDRSGSGRTAYISPPVAAENSLGWN